MVSRDQAADETVVKVPSQRQFLAIQVLRTCWIKAQSNIFFRTDFRNIVDDYVCRITISKVNLISPVLEFTTCAAHSFFDSHRACYRQRLTCYDILVIKGLGIICCKELERTFNSDIGLLKELSNCCRGCFKALVVGQCYTCHSFAIRIY